MTATRIYIVDGPQESRLVRAGSKAQAIRYVTLGRYKAEVAKPETLVELLGEGVKVEDSAPVQAEIEA